jgi:hypothetical protein
MLTHMWHTTHHVFLLCSNKRWKLSALLLRQRCLALQSPSEIEPLGMYLPRFYDTFHFSRSSGSHCKCWKQNFCSFFLCFTSSDYDECLCAVLTLLIFICLFLFFSVGMLSDGGMCWDHVGWWLRNVSNKLTQTSIPSSARQRGAIGWSEEILESLGTLRAS